jgi:hypothetical protein
MFINNNKGKIMTKIKLTVVALVIAISIPLLANAHCQVPCGIYDDEARFNAMLEDATTIEKAMVSIRNLEKTKGRTINLLVRWVDTKEIHADKLTEIVTGYFLTQRINVVPAANKEAHKVYLKKLELLHNIMMQAMKCKQTTDVNHVQKLRDFIKEFQKVYTDKS